MMRRLVSSPAPARMGAALGLAALLALAGCGTVNQATQPGGAARAPARPSPSPAGAKTPQPGQPVLPAAGSGRGGYYKDDGPGENPPPGLAEVPDAEVRIEAPMPRANRSYVVLGKTYTPITDQQAFTQRGTGSWYGKKFHGQRTSSGELYDMYKMTAAHPTLPIPSYARLTSMVSGKQVIVRINDRGPFHASRVIDVSYTAALKLGLLGKGSHELFIERLLPADIERIRAAQRNGAPQAAAESQGPVTSAVAMPESTPLAQLAPPLPQSVALALPRAGMLELPLQTTGLGLMPVLAPMPTPVPTLMPPSTAAGAGEGFYLQLGAFAQADNAEAARARLEPYASGLGRLDVVQAGAVHRLYGGPFASRDEALRAAQGLPGAFGLKPIVVQR